MPVTRATLPRAAQLGATAAAVLSMAGAVLSMGALVDGVGLLGDAAENAVAAGASLVDAAAVEPTALATKGSPKGSPDLGTFADAPSLREMEPRAARCLTASST